MSQVDLGNVILSDDEGSLCTSSDVQQGQDADRMTTYRLRDITEPRTSGHGFSKPLDLLFPSWLEARENQDEDEGPLNKGKVSEDGTYAKRVSISSASGADITTVTILSVSTKSDNLPLTPGCEICVTVQYGEVMKQTGFVQPDQQSWNERLCFHSPKSDSCEMGFFVSQSARPSERLAEGVLGFSLENSSADSVEHSVALMRQGARAGSIRVRIQNPALLNSSDTKAEDCDEEKLMRTRVPSMAWKTTDRSLSRDSSPSSNRRSSPDELSMAQSTQNVPAPRARIRLAPEEIEDKGFKSMPSVEEVNTSAPNQPEVRSLEELVALHSEAEAKLTYLGQQIQFILENQRDAHESKSDLELLSMSLTGPKVTICETTDTTTPLPTQSSGSGIKSMGSPTGLINPSEDMSMSKEKIDMPFERKDDNKSFARILSHRPQVDPLQESYVSAAPTSSGMSGPTKASLGLQRHDTYLNVKKGGLLGCQKWVRRAAMNFVLYHPTVGLAWEILQMVLSAVAIVLYIYETYQNPASVDIIENGGVQSTSNTEPLNLPIEITLNSFFFLDLVLNYCLSYSTMGFLKRWSTWVDILSLIPFIALFFSGLSGLLVFRVARLFRLLRIMRVYRVLYLTESGTMAREIALLIYIVSILILIAAGLFLEIEPDKIESFHNGIYFAVVTITTVGYGDIAPSTVWGRMGVCLFIFVAIIIVPMRINTVVDHLSLRSPYAQSYNKSRKRHVVVTGTFNHRSLFAFLKEFFGGAHGYVDCEVCVLGKDFPDKNMRLLLEGSLASERTTYLQGSPTSVVELNRALVHNAEAVFILTDKEVSNDKKQQADADSILVTLSVRQYNADVPLFVQVLMTRNKSVVYAVGASYVLCIEELRMHFLASSCYCQGLHTLLCNLVTNMDPPDTFNTPDWLLEYIAGAAYSIHEVPLKSTLVGHRFVTICEMLFISMPNVLLIGVRKPNAHVVLNPYNQTLANGDSIIILAPNIKDAQAVYSWDPLRTYFPDEQQDKHNRNSDAASDDSDRDYVADECTSMEEYAFFTALPRIDLIPPNVFNFSLKQPERHKSIVLKSVPPEISGHFVVLGYSNSIVDFVMVLRSKRLRVFTPIVLVTPIVPSEDMLVTLSRFEHTYVVVAEVDKCFTKVGLGRAKNVIILPLYTANDNLVKTESEREASALSADYRLILLCLKIHSWDPNVHYVVALGNLAHARFLSLKLTNDSRQVLRQEKDEAAAASTGIWSTACVGGQVFGEVFADQLLCTLFYNRWALEVILQLFVSPGFNTSATVETSHVFLRALPQAFTPNSSHIQCFKDLFLYLLRTKRQIAIGLLRCKEDDQGPVIDGTQSLGSRYVVTRPPHQVVIKPSDLVYVLAQRQPKSATDQVYA